MKLQIKYVPIGELVLNPRNARQHSDEQIAVIRKSIKQFGFTNPVLINGDNMLIAGEGRYLAAKAEGLKTIPAISLAHLSIDEQRAYAIADNRIPLSSSWNLELLKDELEKLDSVDFDLSTLGFDDTELDDLLEEAEALLPQAIEPRATGTETAESYSGDTQAQRLPRAQDEASEQEEEAPTEDQREAPSYQPVAAEPKGSDRDYSVLELVMVHSDKVFVVEYLNKVRQDRHFDKLADALVHVVKKAAEGGIDV